MKLDGIIFGGAIDFDSPTRPIDIEGISYTSVHRSAGSHRIATFLRQNNLNVEVIDFAPSWKFDEFQELIRSRMNPDLKFVGLGALFNMNTETLWRCFSWLKETYPDVLIITGSSTFHNIHFIPADYLVVGFGEKAILAILNGDVKYTDDIIDKHGNTRRTVHALHDYPAYPMKNLSIDYEDRDFLQPYEMVTMETSRGCRFKCAFCNFPILGVKEDHTRSAEDFADNLMRNYDKYGIHRYSIADETFNDYTDKVIKYADVVEKLSFKPNFGGYVRADLLHSRPGDVEHLARMRFNGHFYGVESFNHESTKAVGKGLHPDKIKQTLIDTKDYFLKHNGYYKGTISLIVGLPHETQETLDQTAKWLYENWKNNYINIHPLMIQRDFPNVPSSTLTFEHKKLGYEIVSLAEVALGVDDPVIRNMLDDPEISSDVKNYMETLRHSFLKENIQIYQWISNTGMSIRDAFLWIVESLWGKKEFMDFGPDHWRLSEWYVSGKTYEEVMGSFKELGGMHPPIQVKVDFIEDYKHKKLSV